MSNKRCWPLLTSNLKPTACTLMIPNKNSFLSLHPRAEHDANGEVLEGWDEAFFAKHSMDELMEILSAAHSLDMAKLVDQGCRVVANRMRGKSPEELRQMFSIRPDV